MGKFLVSSGKMGQERQRRFILTGISHQTEGSFTILGTTDIDSIKYDIGVMPDAANFYYDLSGLNHLIFFSKLKKGKLKKQDSLELMKKVGLEGHEQKKVNSYSFGMKKKLGIAQALVGDPKIIFLDEPTSGLDPESTIEIQDLIKKLSSEGKTIFMTSHNLYEIEKICSRVAIMENGTITKLGTINDLRRMYQQKETLRVKIGKNSKGKIHGILDELKTYCFDVNIKNDYLYCSLKESDFVPNIVFALALNRIEIFELKPEKASLEDIFLEREVQSMTV
jgi:ABC-2 type transport system ATP-binding protein